MKVKVNLKKKIDDGYDILIETGLSKKLAETIANDNFGNSYCIVTDSNMERIFGKKLLQQFKKIKVKADIVSFPAGEKNKNLKTAEKILNQMLAKGFDRKSCVVALGGGIAGDVAGFCAATYLRGIKFVQVPTTLLAMVDSSIGGKTGVNLSKGKNSVGTFTQPQRVYVCPEFLDSLPQREIRNGLAEVVKHAVLRDAEFFDYLDKNVQKLLVCDKKILVKVVMKNCEIKARVVEKDEKEGNYRRIVNFGHTIGHAIEILGNYKIHGHGEAIAIGMVVESEISKELGLLKESEVEKIEKLLHKIGLPTRVPKGKNYDLNRIFELTKSDKKTISGKVYYSLPEKIGKMYSKKGNFGNQVDKNIVMKALRRFS
ncbi:MAG: 3-dehydroquinate synthase [archaeon]|nr:3-dehydroquinate synthase [archaeon]